MAEEPAPAAAAAAAEEPMVIVPPEQIKAMVDKTAEFVARNGEQFEAKIAGRFGILQTCRRSPQSGRGAITKASYRSNKILVRFPSVAQFLPERQRLTHL